MRDNMRRVYKYPGRQSELARDMGDVFAVGNEHFISEVEAQAYIDHYIEAIGRVSKQKKPDIYGEFREFLNDPDAADGYREAALMNEMLELKKRILPDVELYLGKTGRSVLGFSAAHTKYRQTHIFVVRDFKKFTDLSLDGKRHQDRLTAFGTLGHEMMHHMRDSGFITPDEWEILKKEVDATAQKERRTVPDRWSGYRKMGKDEAQEMFYEEAICEMFGEFLHKHYKEASP